MLKATVSLSTDRCFPGQELGLALDLRVDSGWHIYGKPLPANYQALDLILESPLIDEQSLELPAPQPLLLQAFGETCRFMRAASRRTARSVSNGVRRCRRRF